MQSNLLVVFNLLKRSKSPDVGDSVNSATSRQVEDKTPVHDIA